MRNRFISLACWVSAIVISIVLSVLTAYVGMFSIFAIISIIWAALDSQRVHLRRYYTGISGGPITIFILFLILGWPIVFPWYLGMRLKIRFGVARLRDEYQQPKMSDSAIGAGLIQPWKGREL